MKRIFVCFLALTGLFCSAQAQQTPEPKKRVAVFAFDTKSVIGDVSLVRGEALGNKIADVLLIKLVNNGAFSVIDRKDLEKVMAEQDFKYSDRFDQNSVARLGRLLGVDGIIVGSVTHAVTKVDCSKIGWGPYRFGGCTEKAIVGFAARLISTETAEVSGAASAKEESKKPMGSVTDIGNGGSNSESRGGNGEAFSEAVDKAVEKLVQPLAAAEPKLRRVSTKAAETSAADKKQPAPTKPITLPVSIGTADTHPNTLLMGGQIGQSNAANSVAKPTPTPSRYSVEIGVYPNQTQARKHAGQLMITGVDARVAPVELPQRGTWYCVQAGNFPSKVDAQKYGAQLKTKGVAVNYSVVQIQ